MKRLLPLSLLAAFVLAALPGCGGSNKKHPKKEYVPETTKTMRTVPQEEKVEEVEGQPEWVDRPSEGYVVGISAPMDQKQLARKDARRAAADEIAAKIKLLVKEVYTRAEVEEKNWDGNVETSRYAQGVTQHVVAAMVTGLEVDEYFTTRRGNFYIVYAHAKWDPTAMAKKIAENTLEALEKEEKERHNERTTKAKELLEQVKNNGLESLTN